MDTRPVVNVHTTNDQTTGVTPPGHGPRSTVVAHILWAVGGIVSAHRFYLEKPRTLKYLLIVGGLFILLPDTYRFVPVVAWWLTIVGDLFRIPTCGLAKPATQSDSLLRRPSCPILRMRLNPSLRPRLDRPDVPSIFKPWCCARPTGARARSPSCRASWPSARHSRM